MFCRVAELTRIDGHQNPAGPITLLSFAFQIITPALIVGAFAERMRFSTMMLFSMVWMVLVYLPICHMIWGGAGGLFADMGAFDFAGLRVHADDEEVGLDLTQHTERGYDP